MHKTNINTEQVDLSMNRKNVACQDTGLIMEATNNSTKDFIKKNDKNIGKTSFIFFVFNLAYNLSYFFLLN